MKMVSMQVFVDEADAEDIEKSLREWYESHNCGMQHMILNSDRVKPHTWDDDTRRTPKDPLHDVIVALRFISAKEKCPTVRKDLNLQIQSLMDTKRDVLR